MGGTGDITSHLLADEIRGFFCHQSISHQFTPGDGDQIFYPVSFLMIDQCKSAADRSIIPLLLGLKQWPDTCISPDKPGFLNGRNHLRCFLNEEGDFLGSDFKIFDLFRMNGRGSRNGYRMVWDNNIAI